MTFRFRTSVLALFAVASAACGSDVESAPDTPCTSADPSCLSRIAVGPAGLSLPYYRTRSLDKAAPGYRRAIIVLHGTGREADKYFTSMVERAEDASALPYTIVVAPWFQTAPDRQCSGTTDTPPLGDLYWTCSGWKQGAPSVNDAQADSYQAIDAILLLLKRNFPDLERITVAGHSAGGQVAQRYAAANTAEDAEPRVPIRYLVANPSSFLYFDSRRLTKSAICSDADHCALNAASFAAPYYDATSCPDYDEYHYGLEQRTGYTAALPDAQIRAQYVARSVIQLGGALDSAATEVAGYSDLDTDCGAMAEGPSGQSFRLQRGLTFNAYAHLLGAGHPHHVIPNCGHSQSCMFSAAQSRTLLFAD